MFSLGPDALVLLGWDDVLRRGDSPSRGAAELIQELRGTGTHFLVLSSDSSLGPREHARTAGELGIPLGIDDFLIPASLVSAHLRIHHPGRAVHVVGTGEFRNALAAEGTRLAGSGDGEGETPVVVARAPQPDFDSVSEAIELLRKGSPFIGANPEITWNDGFGERADTGALCALLTAATGREPVVPGKPDPAVVDLALGMRLGARREQTVIVGRPSSADHALATAAGIPFIGLETDPAGAEPGEALAGPRALLEELRGARVSDPVLAAWQRAGSDPEQYF